MSLILSIILNIFAILNGCIFLHLFYVNNNKLVLVQMYNIAFFFFFFFDDINENVLLFFYLEKIIVKCPRNKKGIKFG